jgi:hypothetical protein
MALTPVRRTEYAFTPAIGVGAVAAITVFLGTEWVRPPIYLDGTVRTGIMAGVFLAVATGFYRWRIWRRARNPSAYSVRAKSAWALDEDWRHQGGLWVSGLLIGGLILAVLHLLYRQGWLTWAWPK